MASEEHFSASGILEKIWSWVVVGSVILLLLGGGISSMTSSHPWTADIFYLAGAALFLGKFLTWEDAKHQTTSARRKISIWSIGGMAIITLVAIGGNHYLNKPQRREGHVSTLSIAIKAVEATIGGINSRWLDRASGAFAMFLIFASIILLIRVWFRIKKRKQDRARATSKGFLDYKAEAEAAMTVLPKLVKDLTRTMEKVGPSLTKHTKTLLHAKTTEEQINVAKAASHSLDKFSRQFERIGADYESTGKSLSDGLDGWTTWLGKNATIKTNPDFVAFISSMRAFADTIQTTNNQTQYYINAANGNMGVSSVLDAAVDRHVQSVQLILRVNSIIRSSLMEALRRFDLLPST